MAKRCRKVNIEDKKFWNVIYNELSRDNTNEIYRPKYIKHSNSERYSSVYPVNTSDLKVYSIDSKLGLSLAKEIADHFDLDIVISSEYTKIGMISYAIIKIPVAIMNTIYNDDYED